MNCLIFLHIPKTAGSTFHFLLNTRYKESETHNVFGSRYSEPEIKAFIDQDVDEKKHLRLLKGHMPYGLHSYLPQPESAKYISVLRDPVERVISQYYYIKKNVKNPLHEAVHVKKMSIEDFVSSGISIGMNNGHCRFLNGDLDQYPFNSDDRELLESAKRHIDENFLWLGVTERFDESVYLLYKLIGWDKPPYYIKENVSKVRKSREQFTAEQVDIIKEFNQFDIELYDLANKKLDELIESIPTFTDEFHVFQNKNRAKQKRWSWLPDKLRKLVV